MTTFAECARNIGKASLATFGDSVTVGMAASNEDRCWANLLATQCGTPVLRNKGIGGTILQGSPDEKGKPRDNNGIDRFRADLLGAERSDLVAIAYGFNDARFTGAHATLNQAGFTRDYRILLSALFDAGYTSCDIALASPYHIPDAGFAVGSAEFTGQVRENFEAYVGIVRLLAAEFGTFYAPVNEEMQRQGGDVLVSPDHIHPNDAGHAVIAATFASATLAD